MYWSLPVGWMVLCHPPSCNPPPRPCDNSSDSQSHMHLVGEKAGCVVARCLRLVLMLEGQQLN